MTGHILPALTNEEYHARPEVSNSQLGDILRAPALYRAWTLPGHPPRPERAGQLEGTLCHCAVLEPDEFDARYVVIPDNAPTKPTSRMRDAKKPSPETVEAIAWWEAFGREHAGKRFITAQQRDTAQAQAVSIRAIPDVARALSRGKAEVSATWTDPETGIECRCRPDWVHWVDDRRVILLDVKTYSDASPREFARQVARKGYARQDAFYSDGFALAADVEVIGFVFVAAEDTWPYLASACMLDDESREQGNRDYRRALRILAECRAKNEWPAYGDSVNLIILPAWAIDKELSE